MTKTKTTKRDRYKKVMTSRSSKTTRKAKSARFQRSEISFGKFIRQPFAIVGVLVIAVLGTYFLTNSYAAVEPLPISSISADTNDGNVPRNSIDKNLSTWWGAYGDKHWLKVDLGSQKTVDYVKIAFRNGDRLKHRFDIQSSSDGSTWTNVRTGLVGSGTTNGLQVFDLPNPNTRYIRYLGHGISSSNMYNAVSEIELYPTSTSGSDSTAPTVQITNPAESATVNGVVSFDVNAIDNVGSTKVEFFIDGFKKSEDTSPPYSWNWDTSVQKDNTKHTLTAKAYDAAGNMGQATISAYVSFSSTPPPPPPSSSGSISLVSKTSITVVNKDLVTVTKPSGSQAGDVLVAVIGSDYGSVVEVPSGWQLIEKRVRVLKKSSGDLKDSEDLAVQSYYKVATGSEPASYTFKLRSQFSGENSGNAWIAGASLMLYRGVSTSQPVYSVATVGEIKDPNIATCPSVSVPAGGWLICGIVLDDVRGINVPSGLTSQLYVTYHNDDTLSISTRTYSSATTSGNLNAVLTPSTSKNPSDFGQTIVLRPAGL